MKLGRGELADALVVAVRMGLRHGELVALKSEDWRGSTLVVQRAYDRIGDRIGPPKNRKARKVPVHPKVAEILKRRMDRDWLWDRKGGGWRWFANSWRSCAQKVGLPTGTHVLNHTFASWWVQEGGSLMALQHALGHASIDHVMIYAHLAPDSVELEAKRIWGHLGTKPSTKDPEKATSGPGRTRTQKPENAAKRLRKTG